MLWKSHIISRQLLWAERSLLIEFMNSSASRTLVLILLSVSYTHSFTGNKYPSQKSNWPLESVGGEEEADDGWNYRATLSSVLLFAIYLYLARLMFIRSYEKLDGLVTCEDKSCKFLVAHEQGKEQIAILLRKCKGTSGRIEIEL